MKRRRKVHPRASPRAIESTKRIAEAMEQRKSGATFDSIGQHFKVTRQAAHLMVMKGLQAIVAEPAKELIKLEIERLDHMLGAIWRSASSGDLQAQMGVLRIMERRAKLLGLDAPERIEEVGDVAGAKASLLAKINKMAERLAPRPDGLLIEHEPTPGGERVH